MLVSWKKVGDRYVICKNGVYMSLTQEQLDALKLVIEDIQQGTKMFHVEDSRKT